MVSRSSLLVVLGAAVTGVVLARVAPAGGNGSTGNGAAATANETPAPAAGVASSPSGLTSAAAAAASSVAAVVHDGHDDNEPDDSRGGGDNPYDEPPAPRAGLVHVTVMLRDGMLHLPAGRFVAGSSNPHAPANEHPSRTVSLAPFWIDRTEVTVAAYRTCVDARACDHPARASATCTYEGGDGEMPVSCVHWSDADSYCRFAGKRLPSELEWEYAARGTLALSFPWGNSASCTNAVTLINDQSAKSCAPHPAHVGSHPGGASLFGVQDMSGNVEEWTADWYSESLTVGPAPRAGAAHVLRGGGWLSPPSLSRTTARDWGSAVEAGPNVGFRCARDD